MDLSWTLVVLGAIVIVAYLFDFVSRRIRIPSVVLLIFSGIGLRAASDLSGIGFSSLEAILPVLGTFGLILIVLEGALDISLTRDHISLAARSAACALLSILLTTAIVAGLVMHFFAADPLPALLIAIPFSVISSAVAIPAASTLSKKLREFVVYESSMSDIFGVILFYALLRHEGDIAATLLRQSSDITLSVMLGIAAAIAIFWLIQRIDHHVRVLPMLFGLTMLFGAGKLLNLAPLVLVVLVGLMLNNSFIITRLSFGRLTATETFARDLQSFKHLTAEFTFVVRSFFFVLLGLSTPIGSLLNPQAWLVAFIVLLCTALPRILLLRWVARETSTALVFFAPRGLITVLLFLSIPAQYLIEDFPRAVLMLVILMWAVLISFGAMAASAQESSSSDAPKPDAHSDGATKSNLCATNPDGSSATPPASTSAAADLAR